MCSLLDGPTLVRKGAKDLITDGRVYVEGTAEGSPRRAGGQVGSDSPCWMIVACLSVCLNSIQFNSIQCNSVCLSTDNDACKSMPYQRQA